MLRDQGLDRLAQQLVVSIAEHPLGFAVDQDEDAVVIAHHNPIGRGIDQRTKRKPSLTVHGRSYDLSAISRNAGLTERPSRTKRERRCTIARVAPGTGLRGMRIAR